MNPRADRVRRQLARRRNLVVAKAGHFPQEEDISIDLGQRGESLVDGEVNILRWRPDDAVGQYRRFGVPKAPAVMVECEVSRYLEEPGPNLAVRPCRDRRPAHPQEDVLGQITRGVGMADRPAEVLEEAMLMSGEQRFGVDGHA